MRYSNNLFWYFNKQIGSRGGIYFQGKKKVILWPFDYDSEWSKTNFYGNELLDVQSILFIFFLY